MKAAEAISEVAILGGGFNPIGLHHQKIAQRIWDRFKIPTWVMPCYNHLFQKNSDLIDSSHRWNMVDLACQNKKFMHPFDWEIANRHSGSMIETIQRISSEFQQYKFHIVIGTDNANLIDQWDRGNLLIEKYPFIVARRGGFQETSKWFLKDPHKTIDVGTEVSSTKIREAIRKGDYKFAEQSLDEQVWEYIKSGNLYGYKG